MNVLFHAHSGFRYIVLLAGLATVLYAAYGVFALPTVNRTMQRLAMTFAGTFHLQLLLGLALIFSGRFSGFVAGHILLMVFGAASAQIVPSVMRRRQPEARSYLPYLVGALTALALISIGILSIGRPIVG